MSQAHSVQEQNKEMLRYWFEEVWNRGREEVIDQLLAPEVAGMGLAENAKAIHGKDMFKVFYRTLRKALPDLHVTIEDLITEGDRGAIRVSVEGTHTGNALAPATGRRVVFPAIVMVRIANGKIVEGWNSIDQLGLLKQVGALPADGPDRFLTEVE